MGAGLALRGLEGPHAGLSANAKLVLVRMSLSAFDADPEPSYWAGWQPLAIVLALRGKEETNRSKVRRYTRELHTAGAVTLTYRGNSHGPSRYRLWLDMPAPMVNGAHENCLACPVDNSPQPVDNSLSTALSRGPTLGPLERVPEDPEMNSRGPTLGPLYKEERSNKIRSIKGKGTLKLVQPVDNPRSA